MATKLTNAATKITPTLLANGYTAGQVLFAPEELTLLTLRGSRASALRQLGIFWDVADAPKITLYFFAKEPEGWGDAGDTPAPTFETRASLIGTWSVNDAAPYVTMPGDNSADNSYTLVSGLLAVFASKDQRGWVTATIDEAYADDLAGKLKLTLNVDKTL